MIVPITEKDIDFIIERTWNACVDFHNNQGENDVSYPNLGEMKASMKLRYKAFEFRKIVREGEGSQSSYPLAEDVEYETIGLYRNNPDGTQEYLDEMSDEEMKSFREQDDFEQVLLKLNK